MEPVDRRRTAESTCLFGVMCHAAGIDKWH